MFNKLRNRFLIVNLVIISFMMLLAFASIYTITYQNVRRDIDIELHMASDSQRKSGGFPGEQRSGREYPPQRSTDNENLQLALV